MPVRCRCSLTIALGLAATSCAVFAGEFRFGDLVLRSQDGFVVERVAGPPLVERPICADFDERGRLYVADSSGSNEKVAVQLEKKPHRILRLEDTDGDGVFDESVVFADRMMFPEGLLWHDGAVYCGAPPIIWKLEDTDDDGVADRRTEWFDGKTLTGCANDLHGPYHGPDGFIYWCKGAFAQQDHAVEGRRPVSDKAAHIFRMRADGSGFDDYLAGGMDNPVEIAWSPGGDLFFSTTFYTNPRGGQRDALVHGLYGGAYPKVHGVLDPLVRTGDLLPAMTHLGPAAPCGLTRYRSAVFGAEFTNALFSCQFNMHKVARHGLVDEGSSYRTSDSDFLSSDSADFHPTDVLEDADGSLLVIDTGGWYKLCCPTSQIAKPEVLGAIYRIRRNGAEPVKAPRGEELEWGELSADVLVGRLGDARHVVRNRAVSSLAKQGKGSVAALSKVVQGGTDPRARLGAVWALSRIRDPSARVPLERALGDAVSDVAMAALHALAVRRDPATTLGGIFKLLRSESPKVRRAAATTLAHLRKKESVDALLAAAALSVDREGEHALIHALIEIGDAKATRKGLKSSDPQIRRAALIALDQIPGANLDEATLQAALDENDKIVAPTALWIYERHSERGGELAGYFKKLLEARNLDPLQLNDLKDRLARYSNSDAIAKLMADALLAEATPLKVRLLILEAMAKHGAGRPTPKTWPKVIKEHIEDPNDSVVAAAVRAASGAKADALYDQSLLGVARDPDRKDALRSAALAATHAPLIRPDAALFEHLLENIDGATAPVIGKATLSSEQLVALREKLVDAGPLELPNLLSAFKHSSDPGLGASVLQTLASAKAKRVLRGDIVGQVFVGYPPETVAKAAEFAASLDSTAAEKKAKLDALEISLPKGDRNRGHLVFHSAKAACLTCHKMAYRGGDLGPGLERIGSIRTARDLLEAIVFPSASFVRSYEPISVKTKAGAQMLGIVRDQSLDGINLAIGPGATVPMKRSDIVSMEPGEISLMPAGLESQLSVQEIADLIAFLKSMR